MFTAWLVISIIIAGISLLVLIVNVCIGYSDGWVTKDGKNLIRWSSLTFLLSPTGPFILPVLAAGGVGWLLFKIIKGVIVFGFVKDVPIDSKTGELKEKIYNSSLGPY